MHKQKFLLLLLMLTFSLVPPLLLIYPTQVFGAAETWYMRTEQHTVNTFTKYKINATMDTLSLSRYVQSGIAGDTCYISVRVYLIFSDGSNKELTTGYDDIQVSFTSAGLYSDTWTIPEQSLNTTDALLFAVYMKTDSTAWGQGATTPYSNFITVQLGKTYLKPTTLTFYLYGRRTQKVTVPQYTRCYFYWGSSSYQSRVEGIELEDTQNSQLFVNSFDNTTSTNWIGEGSAPYLNNNTASYVYCNGVGNLSWFGFENPSITPQKVYLKLDMLSPKDNSTDDLKVIVSDGSTTQTTVIDEIDYCISTWKTINLTSFLDTKAKVENAKLLLWSNRTGSFRVTVYRAYLQIYAGAEPITYGLTSNRAGDSSVFYVNWYDSDGLSTYAINHNNSGSWLGTNITGSLSGSSDWSNVTLTINGNSTYEIAFVAWANDSLGNWGMLTMQHYQIVYNLYDSTKFKQVSQKTDLDWIFDEPNKRKQIYAENNDYFIQFWSDIHNSTHKNLLYAYSKNGSEWSQQIIAQTKYTSGGLAPISVAYQNRDGVDYVAYVVSGFAIAQISVDFRRGIVENDGTITWSSLQTIEAANVSYAWIAQYLTFTPSGYVFALYTSKREGDQQHNAWLTFSDKTDGTWTTYSGYPKNVTCDVVPYQSEAMFGDVYSLDSDSGCYVLLGVKGMILQGREVISHVVQAVENVSSYSTTSPYSFMGTSYNKNVYVVYRQKNAFTFRFCFRNGTTSNWEIKDEFVTDRVSEPEGHDTYSFPALAYDTLNDEVIVNWETVEDNSIWMKKRSGGSWQSDICLVAFPNYLSAHYNPNSIQALAPEGKILFSLIFSVVADGQNVLYAYTYQPTFYSLTIGWNNITCISDDVAHTLEQVCATINYEGIQATIVIKYNGTEYRYDYGVDSNYDVTIDVLSDELRIYCTSAGTWSREYSNYKFAKQPATTFIPLISITLSIAVSTLLTGAFLFSCIINLIATFLINLGVPFIVNSMVSVMVSVVLTSTFKITTLIGITISYIAALQTQFLLYAIVSIQMSLKTTAYGIFNIVSIVSIFATYIGNLTSRWIVATTVSALKQAITEKAITTIFNIVSMVSTFVTYIGNFTSRWIITTTVSVLAQVIMEKAIITIFNIASVVSVAAHFIQNILSQWIIVTTVSAIGEVITQRMLTTTFNMVSFVSVVATYITTFASQYLVVTIVNAIRTAFVNLASLYHVYVTVAIQLSLIHNLIGNYIINTIVSIGIMQVTIYATFTFHTIVEIVYTMEGAFWFLIACFMFIFAIGILAFALTNKKEKQIGFIEKVK